MGTPHRPDQSPAFWLDAYTGGRWRVIGLVFRPGYDAPQSIRGVDCFYRPLKRWDDGYMRKDATIGFDSGVFDWLVKNTDVRFVVTYGEDQRRLNIAPISSFVTQRNYGQGVQTRALIDDTMTLEDFGGGGLKHPTAVSHIKVESEMPIEETPTRSSRTSPKKKATGLTQRCGCYFENGAISRPCLTHQAQWEPVLRAQGRSA